MSVHGEVTHSGVKKMKWGSRKPRPNGVSQSMDSNAAKDAKEFARSKQFKGKGAEAQRKLIKGKIEGRRKNNQGYKKAFDAHLSSQGVSAPKVKYSSAATAISTGGFLYAHKAGIDNTIAKASTDAYTKAQDPKGHDAARSLLRDMGVG